MLRSSPRTAFANRNRHKLARARILFHPISFSLDAYPPAKTLNYGSLNVARFRPRNSATTGPSYFTNLLLCVPLSLARCYIFVAPGRRPLMPGLSHCRPFSAPAVFERLTIAIRNVCNASTLISVVICVFYTLLPLKDRSQCTTEYCC
jgi:hypothetical protein